MGLFARSADDGLISMGIHGYFVCGKALNAKARVRAAVDEWRHRIMILAGPATGIDLAQKGAAAFARR
jgi:hypothetical protein